MKKQVIVLLILIIGLLLFGCTNKPICGNGVCETGETPLNCNINNGGDCPPVAEYHSACQNNACVQVSGAGVSDCSVDANCIARLCGNGTCDSNFGENLETCPSDCHPDKDLLILISPQYSSESRILAGVAQYAAAVKADINWNSEIVTMTDANNTVGKIRDIIKNYHKNKGVKTVLIIGEDIRMPVYATGGDIDTPTTILWQTFDANIGYSVSDFNLNYPGYWEERIPENGIQPLIHPKETADEIDAILNPADQNTVVKLADMWTTSGHDAVKPDVFVSFLFPLKDAPYSEKVNKIVSSLNKFSSRHNSYSSDTFAYVYGDIARYLNPAFQKLGNYNLIENCNPCNLDLNRSYHMLILDGHADPTSVYYSDSLDGYKLARDMNDLHTPVLIAEGCNIGGWYSNLNPNNIVDPPQNWEYKEVSYPEMFMELVMYPNDLRIVMLGLDDIHLSADYNSFADYLNSGKTIAEAYIAGKKDLRHLFYGDPTFHYN